MLDGSPEGWYYFILLIVFAIVAIAWIGFARFSMARIERQMKKDGLTRQSSWDGVGLRVLWYASAIAFPVGIFNQANDPLIDVPTVRRYSTRFDRYLGWALMISGLIFLAIVLLGGFFFNLD